jgi:hypothetical protein
MPAVSTTHLVLVPSYNRGRIGRIPHFDDLGRAAVRFERRRRNP